MCSVGNDNFETEDVKNNVTNKKYFSFNLCHKCKSDKPSILLRNKDAYCRNCFLVGVTHKFKATLGKSKLIHPKDKVLICYEIGHPSTALLHFLRTGLDLTTAKKIRFDVIILFIDDQYQLTLPERQKVLRQIKDEILWFGFTPQVISFADYVLNPKNIEYLLCNSSKRSEEDGENLRNKVNKKSTKTESLNIKNIQKRQLLVDVAKYLCCKFVFIPQISSDLASDLLTNISLGRGSHVPNDTGFCDDRDEDVKILKPLRLFDIKEIVFYNKFHNLQPVTIRNHEVNAFSSVQDLMRNFVSHLQTNFPATVTTILKTGDKLALESNGTNEKCLFCKAALQKDTSNLTSAEATKFSHLVSTNLVDYKLSRQDRYQSLINEFVKKKFTNNKYCFSCTNLDQINKK